MGFFSRSEKTMSGSKNELEESNNEIQNVGSASEVIDRNTEKSSDLNIEKNSIRNKFRNALSKTGLKINDFFLTEQKIDDCLLENLEDKLILADVGIETTEEIIDELSDRFKRSKSVNKSILFESLQKILIKKLAGSQENLEIDHKKSPFIILVVGVNGVGKTTTIGKIASHYNKKNKTIMLAAGDTFRAAAVEQLRDWGKINNASVISQGTGADSASVIYDAIESARSNDIDILIADTAGRLHTKDHLMEELKKIKRVITKIDSSAPHEVLLVIDAGTGQNAINQMKEFNNAVTVTGLVITKFDGTAKGGIIFSLVKKFGVPVRFVGLGENLDDLQPFDIDFYVQALLDGSNRNS
ncbi:MAG: signal recognition particle-docking protein FtsY [Porticoccus sp.]|nr:signal recognition particle-docking protein FtsY [Porticoccus sp.]